MTDVVSEPTVSTAELRDEVERWLDEHWDPDLDVAEWWRMVADAGWTAPHFTVEQGGRGLSRRSSATVRSVFGAVVHFARPAVSGS